MKKRQEYKLNQQNFLLTFFDKPDHYEEKEIHGYWLVRSFNGTSGRWQVGVYTPETFSRYKQYSENNKTLRLTG